MDRLYWKVLPQRVRAAILRPANQILSGWLLFRLRTIRIWRASKVKNPLTKRHCHISIDLKVRFHLHKLKPFPPKNMLKRRAMQLNHVEPMQSQSIQAINLYYVRISSNIMDWPQKCDLHWCLVITTTWEFSFQLNTYHHNTKNKQKPCQNAPQTTWAHLQTRKKHPSFSTVCYHTSLKKWHQKILKMTPWCCLSTSLLGIYQN